MKPVPFEDQNCVYKAPNCGDLPALKTKDNRIVSCWEMSDIEKELFYKTGKIYLSISGGIQPPVAITVDRPYIRE